MSEQRTIASPQPNPETQKFWDAAKDGKLLIMRCKDTGKPYYYPRARSPFTGSDNVEWVEAAGTAEIYTFSVIKRSNIPYCIAYVRLDEGVTMMTNIVDTDLDKVSIGQKVKIVFKPTEDGQPVPMFTPA